MYDVDPQRPVLHLGELAETAEQRTADYMQRWLEDPAVREAIKEPSSDRLTTSEILALAERQMEEAIKLWSSAYMDWTRERKQSQPIASAQTLSLQDAIDRHVTYSERKKAQSVGDGMMRYR